MAVIISKLVSHVVRLILTVVSQGPNPSVLWASPGTSDPTTLWKENRVLDLGGPETRSASVPPSLLWVRDKATPLQAWTDSEGSPRFRLPDFKTVGT